MISMIGWIQRTHLNNPSRRELDPLIEKYDLHELVAEDLIELNAQDKIDMYEDHISIIFHFPKFDTSSQRYLLNEISLVIGADWIISATRFETGMIGRVHKKLSEEFEYLDTQELYKKSPYYILYILIEILYDKSLKLLMTFNKDLIRLEELVLKTSLDKQTIRSLMIKKRNISFLKYTFHYQDEVLNGIWSHVWEDLGVYFEDLTTKHTKIMNLIALSQENIDSMASTYDALMTINTNNTILTLTIFTWIMLPLTLLTGLFGMNVPLPFSQNIYAFPIICAMMIVFAITTIVRFKRSA